MLATIEHPSYIGGGSVIDHLLRHSQQRIDATTITVALVLLAIIH